MLASTQDGIDRNSQFLHAGILHDIAGQTAAGPRLHLLRFDRRTDNEDAQFRIQTDHHFDRVKDLRAWVVSFDNGYVRADAHRLPDGSGAEVAFDGDIDVQSFAEQRPIRRPSKH